MCNEIKMKTCGKCKEEKEMNTKNFQKRKNGTGGYSNTCVSCMIKRRDRECKEGYKKCKKCKRELPIDNNHFENDNLCLDGHRNICKDCKGGKFGYTPKREWTKEDDEILLKYYSHISNKELVEKYFPKRTERQIGEHATKVLKLRKDEEYLKYFHWSEEQLDYLSKYYSNTDINELVKVINKEPPTIRAMAIKLNLTKESNWSKNDEDILIENYPFMKNKDLVERYFPNRSAHSIFFKAQKLNLSKDSSYISEMSSDRAYLNFKTIHGIKGENHPKYSRISIPCYQCGELVKVTPSKYDNQERIHCSRECAHITRMEIFQDNKEEIAKKISNSWTDEMKKAQAERVVKRLTEMDGNRKATLPQSITNDILDKLNIKYINEYNCKYYSIDNYLVDSNLMIEVQGNFFHCNPVMNLSNSRKTKIIGKDKAKNTYVKRYYNIDILYLWEKDILENIELCEKLIKAYVDSGGKLENYHSYNYKLENSELILANVEDQYPIGY